MWALADLHITAGDPLLWNKEQVADWLRYVDLGDVAPAFLANDVNGVKLGSLTTGELKKFIPDVWSLVVNDC